MTFGTAAALAAAIVIAGVVIVVGFIKVLDFIAEELGLNAMAITVVLIVWMMFALTLWKDANDKKEEVPCEAPIAQSS